MCGRCFRRLNFIFFAFVKKYKAIRECLYNKAVSRNVSFASLSNEDKFMYLMNLKMLRSLKISH